MFRSFLCIDSGGERLCVSVYNADERVLGEKVLKDALMQIRDPELKRVTFEGF